MNEKINFQELNKLIENKGEEFVIVIRYAEKLAVQKRQIMLYNIFEWINMTSVKHYISIIICTRYLSFVDRL